MKYIVCIILVTGLISCGGNNQKASNQLTEEQEMVAADSIATSLINTTNELADETADEMAAIDSLISGIETN